MSADPMCDDHHDGGGCPWCNFAARVREDERGKGEWPRWATAEIRRNALRDAVGAVKALQEKAYWSDLSHAVAAIEALRGER